MKNIILFASGSGSNAENIAAYFASSNSVNVKAVYTNNAHARVIERMKKFNIPCYIFSKADFQNESYFLSLLQQQQADLIVLAGFLWLIPSYLVKAYPNAIINIHPALLPKFGGKGMYGMHVHEAVKNAGETETGITIHYVTEAYDEGAPIFQAKAALTANDTPDSIAHKIHELEMANFPRVIDNLLKKMNE